MATTEQFSSGKIKWMDVTNPSPGEMDELSIEHHLNPQMVRDCLQPEHLPKYEYDDEGNFHFLILRFYAHSAGKTVSSIQELTNKIAIFFNKDVVITIHINHTDFLDSIAKKAAKYCSSTTELLTKIIWQALETFDEPANRLSEQLDFYESQVMFKQTNVDITEALYYIKRQASLSHKVLMLMSEPINHIKGNPGEEALIQDVRDQHLKILTLYGQALEDVNNLLTLSMSFAAQRTNEVVRILTLFSVFFMPLTFIVGIYGMNFEFMPELQKKWGYPAVLIFMALVAACIYFWFKRKRWL
ncbi:MAG: magnesium transporter CorA family protein [Flavitalea sp.]